MPRFLSGKEHKVASSMNSAFQRMLSDSKHAVSYMISEITHICRNMKKRAPGSEGEREAAKYMAGILRSDCGCQNVRLETFREHPAAFYGYFWFSMVFDTLSAILYFVSPWLSILSGCAALFLFVVQFGLAGDGQVHGLFRCAADYCKRLSANIRIDTHANNATMQRQIGKNGFRKCGIIYVSDGSPRLAYQWTASDNCG